MGKTELRIEIDTLLLKQARAAGVNVDALTEAALRAALAERRYDMAADMAATAEQQAADPAGAEARARQWAEENAEAIEDYRRRIAERGIFGEDLRRW